MNTSFFVKLFYENNRKNIIKNNGTLVEYEEYILRRL